MDKNWGKMVDNIRGKLNGWCCAIQKRLSMEKSDGMVVVVAVVAVVAVVGLASCGCGCCCGCCCVC